MHIFLYNILYNFQYFLFNWYYMEINGLFFYIITAILKL